LRRDLKVARLSDERICKRREFQLFGEDTQKARDAKEDLAQGGVQVIGTRLYDVSFVCRLYYLRTTDLPTIMM